MYTCERERDGETEIRVSRAYLVLEIPDGVIITSVILLDGPLPVVPVPDLTLKVGIGLL